MKVLITGGGGYLGSMMTAYMLTAGHDVTVLDTFEHGVYSLSSMITNERLRVAKMDCRRVTESIVREHDAILPLAAVVGQGACDARPADALAINLDAIEHLCRCASPEQALIFPCTNSGYGIGEKGQMCTEASPLRPLSLYGRTKVNAEKMVLDNGGTSLRLATLFGWSMRMRRDLLVNDLTWRAVRDGSAVIYEGGARRNFCHVRDAAAAFVHVLRNWQTMKGQIYNVGDTRANMTKLELCAKIQDHVPFRFLAADVARDPDKRDYLVSNDKLEATGWKPQYSLDQGIEELTRGYQMMRREEHGNA